MPSFDQIHRRRILRRKARVAFSSICLEHRLQIAGRRADDLKHIGGRGLLLQRLREIARLRLHLVEQPDILDGDHGLVGEGLQQVDLLVGERLHGRGASSAITPIARLRAAAARRACVRKPPLRRDLREVAYSGSASTSGTWTISPVEDRPPDSGAASGAIGSVVSDDLTNSGE